MTARTTWISSFVVCFASLMAAVSVLPTTMVQLEEECSTESVQFEESKAVSWRRDCRTAPARKRACLVAPVLDDCNAARRELTPRLLSERLRHNGFGAHLRT